MGGGEASLTGLEGEGLDDHEEGVNFISSLGYRVRQTRKPCKTFVPQLLSG